MGPQALSERLVDFAWGEWSQMGLLTHADVVSPWAQDPEALILLTLELGRYEPRLFDELLDWMSVTESLLSVRRMRAMCVDDTDRVLLAGTLSWLSRQRHRPRPPTPPLEPLFYSGGPVESADPYFAAAGLLRPEIHESHRSRQPDSRLPINLAFQLRRALGVGIRAEAIRVLLTMQVPWVTAMALSTVTAYSKRNVHDALANLTASGVVTAVTVNSEQRYSTDRKAWARLLNRPVAALPLHREWRQLFGSLRRMLRWLARDADPGESEYLRSSRTRDLLEELQPELAFAGVPVEIAGPPEGFPADLDRVIERCLEQLEQKSTVR